MSNNGTGLHERVVGVLRDQFGNAVEDGSGRALTKLAGLMGTEVNDELRRAVRALEEAGYVSRQGSATRTHEIALTEKGNSGDISVVDLVYKPKPTASKPRKQASKRDTATRVAKPQVCRHTRICFVTRHHGDGSTSERWECEDCSVEFRPVR